MRRANLPPGLRLTFSHIGLPIGPSGGGGASGGGGGGGGSSIMQASGPVTLTSGQITGSDVTPVSILSGIAGRTIIPVALEMTYTPSTTDPSGNSYFALIYHGDTNAVQLTNWKWSYFRSGFYTSCSLINLGAAYGFSLSSLVGVGIDLQSFGGTPDGDGSLELNLSYLAI